MVRFCKPWGLVALVVAAGCTRGLPEPANPAGSTSASSPRRMEIFIPMRDGAKLAATLSLPAANGSFSTILLRTPYGKGNFFPAEYVGKYAVIAQDVRGRGGSQGRWEPFLNERKDGYDTVQWIAKQPWSNGKVAMVGASYMAYVQWAAAVENPPALKCILSDSTPPDPYQNIPYENGAFLLATNLWYAGIIGHADAKTPRQSRQPNPYACRPLKDLDVAVTGARNDVFERWLAMESPSAWARAGTMSDLATCKVPALLLTGWQDGDHVGSQLRWLARPDFPDQFLICGDWGHGAPESEVVGDGSPGFEPVTVGEIKDRFLDRYLGDSPPAGKFMPRAIVYLKAARRWSIADAWPPPGSSVSTLQLDSNMTLSEEPATQGVRYEYDPDHINILPQLRNNPMNDMAIRTLHEEDLPYGRLIYHGPILKSPLQVAGVPRIAFRFKTTAVDTDFFFQLFDEAPGHLYTPIGQAGKFRARYFVTKDGALLKPGQAYSASLALWDVECLVPAGDRLAFMVSSDRFPVYALNLNTGEPLATGIKAVKAVQTVLPGSSIAVPILK